MKNARPSNAESSAPRQGAQIIAPGGFPPRHASVSAEVLARLLNRERLTSLDAVQEASTTRLSAVVHYLAQNYGWNIEAADKAAGCREGRVAWVAEYSLPSDTVARAMAAGAANWCAKVRAARRALRAKAVEARRQAARQNATRKRRPHPEQWGLFDGERAQ
ncbi:helix-turn-helix domain-containing protein [Hydrogenophaga sp.]|uniref:helix-turn-helix domain-containing protein n=1 Tax=Hydrogenophaga sp. TaxID=1904254 RepID=UPI00271C67C9|nr:helix-turn-helix domain-containing protein [Hydrogenophaga sp.]MDO8904737.1 helix-turn-helix domain-containing protein [Hydrogenophaga sp.]